MNGTQNILKFICIIDSLTKTAIYSNNYPSTMKHIIIIISLLLINLPVSGKSKKNETLYKWVTVSGIQWREIGDQDIHAKYKGDVMVGKPHGFGTVVYPNGNKYVGEWINGLFQGQGIYTSASEGYKYIGQFRVGSFWKGTMKRNDGTIEYKVVNWKKIKQKPIQLYSE